MKKTFLLFSLCSLLFSLNEVSAYTSTDVSNASFLAEKGLIVTQSTAAGYRLDDTITRAEAVGIALKIKGVVLPSYQCKGYFSDVRNNDWICRAVEIGADHGLVSRANAKFRPSDRITRAEVLAIVMKAGGMGELLSEDQRPAGWYETPYVYVDANAWQQKVINNAMMRNIITPRMFEGSEMTGMFEGFKEQNVYFYPNRNATRAEVFEFSRNITSQNVSNINIKDGLQLEEKNLFFYKNGNRTTITTEGANYRHTPCRVGETSVTYKIMNEINGLYLIQERRSLCDADGGIQYLLFGYQNHTYLESVQQKLKDWYGIIPSMVSNVQLTAEGLLIQGYYTNNTCTDSPECSPGMTPENIKKLGIKILSYPSNGNSGQYEWLAKIKQ